MIALHREALAGACRLASFLLLMAVALGASASQLTILLDTDNNAATGCVVAIPGGTFAGAEVVLNTTVNSSATPPTVGALTRQVCINPATNTLGPPLPVDAGGWPVGIGVGQAGYDAIETYLQTTGLPAGTYRLGTAYVDPSIGGDALVTTNGLAGGPPILFALQAAPPTPVPTLGQMGLALLALLLFAVGLVVLRRYPNGPALAIAIVSIAISTSLWAIVLDGIVVDWNGVSPIAVDPTGDAPLGADIAAFYAKQEPAQDRLYFRVDVKTASVPTAVNDAYTGTAGATLTRPAATGLLANDQLGAPPATLASFGGGNLGGTVTTNAAGTTVPLPVAGSLTVNADGSFSYTPANGFTGTFQFNYRISNGIATSDARVTFTVNQAPAITSAASAAFSLGVPNTFTITATGSPVPAITFGACAPALPAGIGFVDNGNGTGTLSGTPPAGSGGTYNCTVTASNGIGAPASQPFTLTISQAPVAQSDSFATSAGTTLVRPAGTGLLANDQLGVPPATLTSFGGGNAGGTVTTHAAGSTVPLAPGGSLTVNGDGSFSFTPATGFTGAFVFSYRITNSSGTSDGQVTIAVNLGPAITSPNNATFSIGAPNSFTVTTTGAPPPAITFGACSPALPAGVGFVDNGNGTGTLSGTPPAGSGGTYACTVTASNGIGSPASQPFTLTISQAPVAQNDSYSVQHDTVLTVTLANGLLLNDIPGVPPVTGLASVMGNGAACIVFPCAITTAGGGAVVQANGTFVYTPTPNTAGNDTFTYTISNGVGVSGATVTINVTNALPVVDLNGPPNGIDFGPVTFTEGGGPIPIVDAAQLTVTDADSPSLASATVVITNLLDNGAELLSVVCPDVAPGCSGAILAADVVYTPATGTLAINRVAPLADYQALLRTLRYDNTSPTPNTAQRDITVTVNDRIANNNPLAHSLVSVAAVNTAPVLAGIEPAALVYPVSTPAVSITSTLTVTDADSPNLASATVQLTAGCVAADDVLSFANTASITGSYTPATCLMTLTGSDTPANYQAALRNVKYANNNPATAVTPRTASFRANDGTAQSNIATRNINVQVNTPPVLANIEAAPLAYSEGGAATAITSTLTVTDSDSPNLAGATVQLTGGCASGEDVLGFTPQSGITGSYAAATCLMTLSGSATVANYQAALRSVTYFNSSNNPSTATRTASFQANDGAAAGNLSNIVARSINISAVNNAPVLTAGGTLNYTENDPAAIVDGGVTVTDADSPNLASATVQITGNCSSGQDVLSFVNQNGITGSYTAGTCTMTLTGSATVANYQTALRSVRYANTSENPSTASRTVTWIANDGSLSSSPATSTITVTAVNDAPTLLVGGGLSYTEGQAATSLISSATITDVDSVNMAGATVQITGNYASGEDVLSYAAALGITGSFNAGTGMLTLSGSATIANYQTALANVKYANTSNNPSTLLRTVTWQVNDGGAVNNLSNTVTSSITVIAVNNPPTAFAWSGLPAQAGIPITYPAGKLGGTDPEGTAITIVTTPDSLCAGCALTINADGSFTFTPPPSSAGGTASFTYHVTDSGNPPPGVNSPPATVSFNVAGPAIWFVKSPAVGTGNCTLGNECLLGTAVTNIGLAANASIFVGDANTHAAGFTLNAGGSIAGQGMTASFDTFYAIAAPAQGTLAARPATNLARPVLTGGVGSTLALGASNTLRGFDIANTSLAGTALSGVAYGTLTLSEVSVNATGAALNLSNGAGTVTFDSLTSAGGTSNVVLNTIGGTMALSSGGSLTGATARAIDISGGTGSIGYGGSISNSGTGIAVANKTGGTVTLSGANKTLTTGANPAVTLTSNTGATIDIGNGGLQITTTGGTGFSATGGGIVTVGTGANSNTISSGTGTALNVVNTTIGAAGLTFRSIASSGGSATGIILDTTGASGGLTVTGDGSNVSVGGNGTGGTIANKTGADGSTTTGIGVYLRNTQNVALRRMIVNGTNTNYGIKGYGVSGFALEYSTVGGTNGTNFNAAPNNAGEGSIYFGDYTPTNGVTGAVSLLNNNISGGAWSNVAIINSSGTATLTIKGNTFGANGLAPTGNSSLLVEARNSAVINTTLGGTLAGEPNTFTSARADLVNFTGQQTTTMDVAMRNNVMSNNHPNNNIGGGSLTLATAGTMTFNVDGNTMRDADGSAVTLFKASAASGTPTMSGRFTNNTIGNAAVLDSGSKSGNGIFVSAGGTGTMSFTINNNAIHQIHGNAHIYADNTGGSFAANFTIEGNLLDTPNLAGWFAGIAITNGAPASSDTINVCAKVGGAAAQQNTLNLAGNLGIIVGSSGSGAGHTFNLPGYAGGASLVNVQNFLQANNTGAFFTNAYADAPATASAFTGIGATCPTP